MNINPLKLKTFKWYGFNCLKVVILGWYAKEMVKSLLNFILEKIK